jgi:hypothetical protein
VEEDRTGRVECPQAVKQAVGKKQRDADDDSYYCGSEQERRDDGDDLRPTTHSVKGGDSF